LPPIDWRAALKAFLGFLAGLAIWVLLSPAYDGLLARAATGAIRTFEDPPVTRLRPQPDRYTTIDRSDFDPRSKRPAIAISDLTFNFLLLTALFSLEKRVFRDRNILGFVLATVVLTFTHVFGVVAEVMSIYVAKLGPWSRVHYSDLERNLWGVANHSYRLVLMYAFAFAAWWIFRPASAAAADKPRKRARR
jgi:hypothetical protein